MTRWRRSAGFSGRVPLFLSALIMTVSACSSGEEGFFRRLGDLTLQTITPAETAQQRSVTRAELNQIPYATIAVSSDGGARAYLVPQAINGRYLDYRDESGNSLRMLGGAVAGLQTAGWDLDAVLYDPADPIAAPRPLTFWPKEVWRQYQFPRRNLDKYVIALRCVFLPVASETIEIVEIRFTLTRVNENCSNARRSVTNTYWIEPDTGFIWKSEQWLGPRIGTVVVEIIRPYADKAQE